MKLPTEDTDMRDFLRDFLPKLKKANEELEEERRRGTLEKRRIEVDGEEGKEEVGGQYIEMSLGLGVLEEKDPDEKSESESEESDGEEEKDILGKLLKREKVEGKKVQEVEMKDT